MRKKKTSRVSVTRNINCGADKLYGGACRRLRELLMKIIQNRYIPRICPLSSIDPFLSIFSSSLILGGFFSFSFVLVFHFSFRPHTRY